MARFFIDRPVFAWVIAIIVMLAGVMAIQILPVAQYPPIAPPAIAISANYPGASAKTLEDTVTQVIEQKMKGLDNLDYMASTSESNGTATITLTFKNGTDPDIAQMQVQNKLSLATPQLPTEVQNQGLEVNKSSASFLAVIAFTSEDGSMTDKDLADFVAANVQEPLSRVDGVGETQLFGSQYAMRIWLDPDKLHNYALTALDVQNAIQSKNVQVSAGQLGALPAIPGQQLNATITAQTQLRTAEQFRNIVLRTTNDGAEVRLADVARIELGSENYGATAKFNGKPAAGLALKLATGANALDTVDGVRSQLDELAEFFPQGMGFQLPYDTTPFVRIAIEEVVHTLIEAVILVFLVMFLFMQNLRATLIPTIAVPVVLLGTFGVVAAFGYSINTLTMFGVVLAIGLLVDDAIVVVENVERIMSEDGLPPREATRKSMGQITGALVGVTLVLSAVFIPMAFISGSVGVIYRQFSVTIVSAMALSLLVAMVLTPALCATMLKPLPPGGHTSRGPLGLFFNAFNRLFERGTRGYQGAVAHMLKRSGRYFLLYALLTGAVLIGFQKIPSGFLPDEDQGTVFTIVQLPPGAAQSRTLDVLAKVEQHFLVDEKDAVDSIFSVAGFSFAGSGQNMGFAFVKLKPWDQRNSPELKADAVTRRAMQVLSGVRDASIFAFIPPAVAELGNATGFDLMLQDRANLGHEKLTEARDQLLAMAMNDPTLVGVRPNGLADAPQLELDIDEHKAGTLGVSLSDIHANLSATWGGSYVNDFIDRGRVKKVYLQADAPFRMLPQDIERWYVKNASGDMVSFASFATARWSTGSPRLERYNGVPSMEILGMALPGAASSGQAMATMEDFAARLPSGFGIEWTGLSRQERASGSQASLLYAVSLLVVFLCLAALYESWAIPTSVILVVPLGILGCVVAAILGWRMNDVYFQVGLLTTVGLASKNAILIVEFAKALHEQGMGLAQAAIEAARMRLRPILMTSLAFILGVLPLTLNDGAGAGAQNALGSTVMGGMISATVLAIFFVPLFFLLVLKLTKRAHGKQPAEPANLTDGVSQGQ